jgi:trehalose/maltose hydrolase-like predicted phosphorylase
VTPDPWTIVETAFDVTYNRHYEGLLAIGSGTLQQRGSLEEGLHNDPQDVAYLRVMGNVTVEQFPAFKSRVGTYLPGVTGHHPTCLDEMINLPALHGLILYAGGERLDMQTSRIRAYSRRLDLRTGHLIREFTWDTPRGGRLRVHFERFVSAYRRHVMALRCTLAHLAGPPVELRLLIPLDAEVRTNGFDHFTSVDITGEHEPITLAVRTDSGIDVAAAALVTSDCGLPWTVEVQPRWVACCGAFTLDAGRTLLVDKVAALTSSRHVDGPPLDAARRLVWSAAGSGFERLAAESDAVWQQRWEKTDIVVEGDPASQLALRVCLYHLLRAVVEDDPRVAIDAKAAAGEAYCGRYFWDTEVFMLPLFLATRPEVGRTLARFRIASLEGARRNARRYGYPGARYGWESSPSGDESCPNWQYADHEVHVTADVAYGLVHAHLCNPDDRSFLRDVTEVLIECARYWCARATHSAERDCYELLMVMGPDEYTPFSRNNTYTNRLVAFALRAAAGLWGKLEETDGGAAARLREDLRLADDELGHFVEVANKLRLPYDAQRGLVLQSDDFFSYEPLDWARFWPDRSKRLAACVSQERLYRSQVLKQADVLQLMALFPREFDVEQMRTAYETYEPLTSHDSSLSKATHALIAAWIGKADAAYRFWQEAVGLDLRPGEASEGIHAACAGACWEAAILGFGGVRTRMQAGWAESAKPSAAILSIDPHLPASWTALRFPFVWNGQPLYIAIEPRRVTIDHRGTNPISARILGQRGTLPPGQTSTFVA